MKRIVLVLHICLFLSLAHAVFAEDLAPVSVDLTISEQDLEPYDFFTITATVESRMAGIIGDLYLVIELPDHTLLSRTAGGWQGGLSPLFSDWVITDWTETVVNELGARGIPTGDYTVYLGVWLQRDFDGDGARDWVLDQQAIKVHAANSFVRHYNLPALAVSPRVTPYSLPLTPERIANWDSVIANWPLSEAERQTAAACLIASQLLASPELKTKWDEIYRVTSFYVGYSNDLGPYQYQEALNAIFKGDFQPTSLTGEMLQEIKRYLVVNFQPPQIYGGTGACELPAAATPEMIDECISKTMGFRFMGQRFVPDSYIFSRLVGFAYQGDGFPFTRVDSMAGPIRGFPRGLDIMAIFGSDRAKELLQELGDDRYEYYLEEREKLIATFSELSLDEWNQNLYWAWLYALQPLLMDIPAGYPIFMQTDAWRDRQLTSALASWAQLRHDTILYAKQSYTPTLGVPIEPEEVTGYVEPQTELYNRLLSLTSMTLEGLDEMGVLDDMDRDRLQCTEGIIERLLAISQKELQEEALNEEDIQFINDFADELNACLADVDDRAKKTTIIADVHTDQNSGKVLEEGTGFVKLLWVAYRSSGDRILLGIGPVLSYYEFKHPMSDRLTDEAWRELISSEPPNEPEWISTFAVISQ